MSFARHIARELSIRPEQVAATIALLDEGNTLPFIARYRKEATGSLDEIQLRRLSERLRELRTLEARRKTILNAIEKQDALTPQLREEIGQAQTAAALEDLYQPFRPKRRTRASIARETGLQPLADLILAQQLSREGPEQLARPFLGKDVATVSAALAGARDIVAETISDHPKVRGIAREKALQWGTLYTERRRNGADQRGVFKHYYDFECNVARLRPHQVLAINRGESEKVLRVRLDISERDWLLAIHSVFRPHFRSPMAGQLRQAAEDAAKRLLLPAIARDVRRHLTEQAETHAIGVFATNLRNLLLQPPMAGHTVLGIDPGFRTGCKLAVVDPTGKLLTTATIYPHQPQGRAEHALKQLARLVTRHSVTLVAVGNGTAARETELLVARLLKLLNRDRLHYLIVSEAGASVYSASELAAAELPDLDVTLRGAVSIARRVQDPLAELVKIDPKSIGVGLYQHDVNQSELSDALSWVVTSVVNQVGAELNTASAPLLTHVAGIGPRLADKIVAHREKQGPFRERRDLLEVAGLGPRTFEQAAGFLRISNGENPLDATAIHPESYSVAKAVLNRAGIGLTASPVARERPLARLRKHVPMRELAAALGVGAPTLQDIFDQLVRPGRDPRQDAPAPILRSDVLSVEDLALGMKLRGTVRNVVDFGAFIDIGVKHDGLLHRSKKPRHVQLRVGDVVTVEILKVEPDRGRISLGWPQQ